MIAVRMLALAGAAVLVLVPLAAARTRASAEPSKGFLNRVHKDADGKESRYVLFVPHDYTGDKAYPVILFLHGAGGRMGRSSPWRSASARPSRNGRKTSPPW